MDLNIDSMTVAELRKELKSRSLKQSGKKRELKERLIAAIEAEVIEEESGSHDDTNPDNQHTDFADFEEYINDEYNRLNKGQHNESLHDHDTLTIDDIINNTDDTEPQQPQEPSTQDTEPQEEDEQKNILLEDEPNAVETPTPGDTQPVIADFSDDPMALNTKSKMDDRMKRFGTAPVNDKAQIESRKRRFESKDTIGTPPAKKQRVNHEEERAKILKRAQKFGTNVPKHFKLTKEETDVIYADQIDRAKRFGTEHLLPARLKRAELNAKKEERMKRFKVDQTSPEIQDEAVIKVVKEGNTEGTKLMERKLRFGTMNDTDKQTQRQERFGTGNTSNKGNMNGGKKLNQRQFRNKQRFEKFRAYNKNNRNNNRGRGRGRSRGRGRGRGRGGFGRNNNYANGQRFNNNTKKKNLQFSSEDMDKINQRKLRFSAM
eukprot:44530_1